MSDVFDVVLLGGGASGLSAARTVLGGEGFRGRLLVLEGRDRLGGRIASTKVGGVGFDTGAAWVHGVEGNPMVSLLPSGMHPVHPRNLWTIPCKEVAFVGDRGSGGGGKGVDGAAMEAEKVLEEVGGEWEEGGGGGGEKGEEETLAQLVGGEKDGKVRWFLWMVGCWFGIELSKLSASDVGGELQGDFPGAHCVPKGGMTELIRTLESEVREKGADVRLEAVVEEVVVVGGEAVGGDGEVFCVRLKGGEVVYSRSVINTLPLNIARSLPYSPPLPEDVMTAMNGVEMGNYTKIIISLAPPPLATDGPIFLAKVDGSGEEEAEEGWVVENHARIHGVEGVVAGILWGKRAKEAEAEGNAEGLVKQVVAVVEEYSGRKHEVVDFHVTSWSTDPFARGAYSFVPHGVDPAACDTIAAPLYYEKGAWTDKISTKRGGGEEEEEEVEEGASPAPSKSSLTPLVMCFAGEACHAEYIGAVHGALMSGEDAAKAVLHQLSKE